MALRVRRRTSPRSGHLQVAANEHAKSAPGQVGATT